MKGGGGVLCLWHAFILGAVRAKTGGVCVCVPACAWCACVPLCHETSGISSASYFWLLYVTPPSTVIVCPTHFVLRAGTTCCCPSWHRLRVVVARMKAGMVTRRQ